MVDLEPETNKVPTSMEIKLKRVKARLKRDREKKKTFAGEIKTVNKFELDADITKMRKPFTPEFYQQWEL